MLNVLIQTLGHICDSVGILLLLLPFPRLNLVVGLQYALHSS